MYVISQAFSKSTFPNHLKKAFVMCFFEKKGITLVPFIYRPISSLTFHSNSIERFIKNRLCLFQTKSYLFSASQYGFLRGLITADVMINLTEQLFYELYC